MVSTRPPTSKSSSPFSNPLVTVSNNWYNCHLHVPHFCFFSIPSQGRGIYPSFHILSVLFCGQPGQQSRQFCKFSFFLLIIIKSGLLAEIRWSMCMSKSHRSLCVSFSMTGTGLCIYHLFVWSNLNFLHISQWITLPTQSCLVLYSIINLLYSLYYHYFWWVSHISVSRWSFTGVWMTASVYRSPVIFSEFWPILKMLSFGWSPFVLQFANVPSLFRDHSKCANYNWYHRYFHVPQLY